MITKVLYIAGTGRSGSTLLGNMLGEAEAFLHIGELMYFWKPRFLESGPTCGCGTSFAECPVWEPVLGAAFEGHAEHVLAETADFWDVWRKTTLVARMLRPGGEHLVHRAFDPYRAHVKRLYAELEKVKPGRIFIDGSKSPAIGYWLDTFDSLDVRFVHLIRDPRGTYYSELKNKLDPYTGQPMGRAPFYVPIGVWVVWNLMAEKLGRLHPDRYLRVRYEDLIASPEEELNRIFEFMNTDQVASSFVQNGAVSLNPQHTVFGNPVRAKSGPVPLRPDTAWRQNLSRGSKALVVSTCGLLMKRYGYL